ncbi:hypothetical protein ACJMK2_034275 [Sinanodonta woodiana]|uniref:procollagen-proline 4-dioxygenase n=1 Tax=Sinanodonta woodiana TaxID=1069815 RepID=A0ABD3WR19_SINWO
MYASYICQYFFIIAACFISGNADVHSAVIKLNQLAQFEADLVSGLQEYVTKEKTWIDRSPILQDIERFLSAQTTREPNSIAENPINAFHLVRNIYRNREIIRKICEYTKIKCCCKDNNEKCTRWAEDGECSKNPDYMLVKCQRSCNACFKETNSTNQFHYYWGEVTEEDLHSTASALVRLWRTYNLNINELIQGKIWNDVTSPLTPLDLFDILKAAGDEGLYESQIVWTEAFIRQVMNIDPTGNGTIEFVDIYRILAQAYFKKSMPWRLVEILIQRSYKEKDYDLTEAIEKFKQNASEIQHTLSQRSTVLEGDVPHKHHYEALCRGDVIRHISVTSRLKCYLRDTIIPFYKGKEEVLNFDPRLSIFHDVIHESERRETQTSAVNFLQRSRTVGEEAGDPNYTIIKIRQSQTAWMCDKDHSPIRKLSKRVEILTGLSTSQLETMFHAEDMQVVNYGIGGMYEAHKDYFEYPLSELKIRDLDPLELRGSGDRLATWLFYLTDVKAGGATVFTKLNVTVPVTKGAAAFWYNINRTGAIDERTEHAGCPVLLGSKWVANKWIRETGQVFRRKCGKTIDDIDEPF